MVLVLCAACSDGGPGSPTHPEGPNARILHWVDTPASVVEVRGSLTEFETEWLVERPLGSLGGESFGDNVLVAPLPCLPAPETVTVLDADGNALSRHRFASAALYEKGFATILPQQRVAAASFLHNTGKLLPRELSPKILPPRAELSASEERISHAFFHVAERSRLTVFARHQGPGIAQLEVHRGDTKVGTLEVDSEWRDFTVDYKSIPGRGLIHLIPQTVPGAVHVAWMELDRLSPPLILVHAEQPKSSSVRYSPALPTEEATRYPDANGNLSFLAVGGPVSIRSLKGTARDQDPGSFSPWRESPAAGLVQVPAPASGAPYLLQRDLAPLVAQAVHPDLRLENLDPEASTLSPALTTRLFSRMEVWGDRRNSLWLPTASSVAFRVTQLQGVLRYAVGLPRSPPRPMEERLEQGDWNGNRPEVLPTHRVDFEVLWRPEIGEPRVLDQVSEVRIRDRWRDQEVSLKGLHGPGILEFRTESADGVGIPAAFADPRVVPPSSNRSRPNVIVYLIDTLRAENVSAYGHHQPTTPFLDSLAEDGFLFERFYAVAPWTRPTTATLLTGYYPSWHGVAKGFPVPESLDTLAESFRRANYSTWAFIANVQVAARGLQFHQGFHRFVAQDGLGINTQTDTVATSTRINQRVIPWLEQCGDEPFFLYLHSMDPHTPYRPPDDFEPVFGKDYQGMLRGETMIASRLRALTDQMDEADVRYVEDIYDNEIRHQDNEIRALFDALEATGLKDNTVVAIVSDHGEEFLEHGDWNHGYRMWDEQLRVPFVFWMPTALREKRGWTPQRIVAPLTQADFATGLLDAVGIDDPFPRQGTSWVPLLAGNGELRPCLAEDYITWGGDEIGALAHGNYKLIWTHGSSDEHHREQLFDLDADPDEIHDLANQQPEVLQGLLRLRGKVRQDLLGVQRRLQAAGYDQVLPSDASRDDTVRLESAAIQELEALGYLDDGGH